MKWDGIMGGLIYGGKDACWLLLPPLLSLMSIIILLIVVNAELNENEI